MLAGSLLLSNCYTTVIPRFSLLVLTLAPHWDNGSSCPQSICEALFFCTTLRHIHIPESVVLMVAGINRNKPHFFVVTYPHETSSEIQPGEDTLFPKPSHFRREYDALQAAWYMSKYSSATVNSWIVSRDGHQPMKLRELRGTTKRF